MQVKENSCSTQAQRAEDLAIVGAVTHLMHGFGFILGSGSADQVVEFRYAMLRCVIINVHLAV